MGGLLAAVRRGGGKVIAAVVVIAIIVVSVVLIESGGTKTKHITAYFSSTIGVYVGNDVRILGVKVGKIDSITPDGKTVKVVMSYDGNDKVPATADAVIVEPSIVSDRYIQLQPGYTPGSNVPVMADNAVLQTNQTRVPIELDQVFGNINTLDAALGPKGANKHGALSRLVTVGAANLKGNGGHFNKALKAFSAAISTLAGSRGDLFDTVNNLQQFTSTLAANDGGIRKLNSNLALVGGQLAGERQDLGAALANLSTALSAVNSFVADNRTNLTSDIHGLSKVTNVLTKEKEAITQFTDMVPLALSDLGLSYDPVSMTLDTKSDTGEPATATGPSGTLCILLTQLSLENLLPGVTGCMPTTSKTATTSPLGSLTSTTTPTVQSGNDLPHTLAGLLGVTK
jgi:phospholipid/cholesterol/gamma-HCH transport system substrate-binding protein